MRESEFVLKKDEKLEGSSKWISPSNIALVKYWGKYDSQIPKNPSLSFTLTNCYTETKVSYLPKKNKNITPVYSDKGSEIYLEPFMVWQRYKSQLDGFQKRS